MLPLQAIAKAIMTGTSTRCVKPGNVIDEAHLVTSNQTAAHKSPAQEIPESQNLSCTEQTCHKLSKEKMCQNYCCAKYCCLPVS